MFQIYILQHNVLSYSLDLSGMFCCDPIFFKNIFIFKLYDIFIDHAIVGALSPLAQIGSPA